jgi:SAM-dependent methyltransferase
MVDGGGDRRRTWEARYQSAGRSKGRPASVLCHYAHLLPASGAALDLACGLGGNALFLARRGWRVSAWDYSATAIAALDARARELGIPVEAAVRDVIAEPPPSKTYDLIVVSDFLERALFPAIVQALRPGGLLFYETFTAEAVDDSGPRNPAFRLQPNELLHLALPALRILLYREEGQVGDPGQGMRNRAQLVGSKPE